MISSPTGACRIAQPASVRHAVVPNRTRLFIQARLLMKLPNEPVELRRDSQEDFADDMNHLALLSINRAAPARASCKEKLAVLRRKDEAHRDALFRCDYR